MPIVGSGTWALDVADNASCGIVHELYAHLSDTSAGAYAGSEYIALPMSRIGVGGVLRTGAAEN